MLIVALGGNDGLRGLPVSELKHNLKTIVTRAQELDHPFRAVPYVGKNTGVARCQSISAFDWHGRLAPTAVAQRA